MRMLALLLVFALTQPATQAQVVIPARFLNSEGRWSITSCQLALSWRNTPILKRLLIRSPDCRH